VAAAKPAAVDSRTFTGGGGQFLHGKKHLGQPWWRTGRSGRQTNRRQTNRTNKRTDRRTSLKAAAYPLMGTLKLQNNGPLYSNTVLVHWPLMGGLLHLVQRGGAYAAPPSPLLAVPNVTAHPSTASGATSYYSMWHYYTGAH